jgi:membrane associated rhomboid family serine protease
MDLLRNGPPVSASRSSARQGRIAAAVALVTYGVVLALVAFWPRHIDQGLGPTLRLIVEVFPWASRRRLEVGANVVLFVPLGLLLTFLLDRSRYLVLPIGFLASFLVESVQAVFLPGRTPSLLDIAANTAGVCVGVIIASLSLRDRNERPT